MLSKTCEYAIRAMIFIAQTSKDGRKAGIKEISKGIDSPEHFTAKILQDLSKKRIVQSMKGPNGGFFLDAYDLENTSIAQIVEAIDGDNLFVGCGLGLKRCSETHPCPLHNDFKKIRNELRTMLENAKLCTFTNLLNQEITFLKTI